MKCPYRKVTYHHPAQSSRIAYEEEGFAECHGKECPYYDNGYCSGVLKIGGVQNERD